MLMDPLSNWKMNRANALRGSNPCFGFLFGAFLLCSMLLLSGCQQVKEQFGRVRPNNPVVGPAPPRLSVEENSKDALGYAQISKDATVASGVLLASHDANGELKQIPDAQIVAMVNGDPILAGDIFGPYTKQMEMMRKQLPAEQFALAQRELLKRDLPDSIERTLLAHALKTTLKQEQIDQLDTILDNAFKEHVARLLVKTKTASARELDLKLQADGTSLEQLRKTFGAQQLAMQYLSTESEVHVQLGRVDLLKFYNENIEKYTHPAQVEWQEIRVSFDQNNGRSGAIEKLNQAVSELQQGKDFAEVAREYSDGATASNGGTWEWTRQGSLADKKIEQMLFKMKKGQVSQVIESPGYFQILKITDRKDAKVTPFEQVQQNIQGEIYKLKKKKKTAQVIEKLKASADIETIFDNDPEIKAAMRDFGKFNK